MGLKPLLSNLESPSQRFLTANLAKKMDLRHKLMNLKKQKSQSMESYLHEIKDVVDSLAAINSPLTTYQELAQYTDDGLDDDYKTFTTIATYFGANFT